MIYICSMIPDDVTSRQPPQWSALMMLAPSSCTLHICILVQIMVDWQNA